MRKRQKKKNAKKYVRWYIDTHLKPLYQIAPAWCEVDGEQMTKQLDGSMQRAIDEGLVDPSVMGIKFDVVQLCVWSDD